MLITLPDASIVSLDVASMRFREVRDPKAEKKRKARTKAQPPRTVDLESLAYCLSSPDWKFGDCFRRIPGTNRFSPKSTMYEVPVCYPCRIYAFPGRYSGGCFSSSTTEWRFLDGRIHSHSGYGWGSHSWTVVEGFEALRAVCLFIGIIQPQRLRGETSRRPLAVLLEEMSAYPLCNPDNLGWHSPSGGD